MIESLSDIRELGELARLDVFPDDKFVLMTKDKLSLEIVEKIYKIWSRFSPGTKLLVLDNDLKLAAIREVGDATS